MEDTKACLFSHVLDGNGGGKAIELHEIADGSAHLVWIHINGKHADAKKFLRDQASLDPLICKSLLAEETRPRLEEIGENALIILRGIHFNPGPEPEDLVSIRLWVTKNRIITVGRRKSRAISDIDEKIRQGRGPRRTGEFVSMLCSNLHDGIESTIQDIEETLDIIEDKSLDTPDPSMRADISRTRKQATLFRRHMTPQRDVVARLNSSKVNWLNTSDKWFLQDSLDHVNRFIEDLDAIRERSQIVHDELASALSIQLNKNIYALSVITVVFMPLTFLTGLLGMNVAGIPAADSPLAFLSVCVIAIVVTIIQLLLFKRFKWF